MKIIFQLLLLIWFTGKKTIKSFSIVILETPPKICYSAPYIGCACDNKGRVQKPHVRIMAHKPSHTLSLFQVGRVGLLNIVT